MSLTSKQNSEQNSDFKIVLPDKVDISVIKDVLKLNNLSVSELAKVDSYTFNIFTLRE